jgi:hypothetical protein
MVTPTSAISTTNKMMRRPKTAVGSCANMLSSLPFCLAFIRADGGLILDAVYRILEGFYSHNEGEVVSFRRWLGAGKVGAVNKENSLR